MRVELPRSLALNSTLQNWAQRWIPQLFISNQLCKTMQESAAAQCFTFPLHRGKHIPFRSRNSLLAFISTSTLIFWTLSLCLLAVACVSFSTDGLVLGGSVRSKELDVMIHMGPFQSEKFYTSTALIHNLQGTHRRELHPQPVDGLDIGIVWVPSCSWQSPCFPKILAVPKTSHEAKSSPLG